MIEVLAGRRRAATDVVPQRAGGAILARLMLAAFLG
jgi:hypothetical protein